MATHAAGANLELQLHPGDEYVGSWEPESLQVLVGIYWSVVWQYTVQIWCLLCLFPTDSGCVYVHTHPNTNTMHTAHTNW